MGVEGGCILEGGGGFFGGKGLGYRQMVVAVLLCGFRRAHRPQGSVLRGKYCHEYFGVSSRLLRACPVNSGKPLI